MDNGVSITGTEQKELALQRLSVIVPVYNGEANISVLLESLLKQDYPKDHFEIIIVDNNSTDETIRIARQYPVTILEEKIKQTSYAARNLGIKHARHDILAFIDSDCVASTGWLSAGTKALESESADLVGGRVEFTFSARRTTAELYDSITNMQVESNIRERNVAKTANLLVRRKVFDKVGLFPDDVRSGGDVQWTERATKNGFKLVYSAEAFVRHPARTISELLVKQLRVGKGMVPIWRSEGRTVISMLTSIMRLLLPPKFSVIKTMTSRLSLGHGNRIYIDMWMVSYLCRSITGLGALSVLVLGGSSVVTHES
jgi:glycosyltransferase involved in cell wall biosynthesis